MLEVPRYVHWARLLEATPRFRALCIVSRPTELHPLPETSDGASQTTRWRPGTLAILITRAMAKVRKRNRTHRKVASARTRHRRYLPVYAVVLVVLVAAGIAWFVTNVRYPDGAHLIVKVPVLSRPQTSGSTLFAANCARCHGINAAGSDNGPPLIHKFYEPGHHGSKAFFAAVRNGVRAHHWRYGDMPPVNGLNDQKVGYIVTYIRALQRANGID